MNISSEEPHIHWSFLPVSGHVVLDLGCNKFYSRISTAEYFLNREAKLVIGIDLVQNDFVHKNFIMEIQNINSAEQIESLIKKYKPSIIKSDIEGSEKYFKYLNNIYPCSHIAIEYHDNKLKTMLLEKLSDFKFVNYDIYSLFNEDIDRIGVIHAWT